MSKLTIPLLWGKKFGNHILFAEFLTKKFILVSAIKYEANKKHEFWYLLNDKGELLDSIPKSPGFEIWVPNKTGKRLFTVNALDHTSFFEIIINDFQKLSLERHEKITLPEGFIDSKRLVCNYTTIIELPDEHESYIGWHSANLTFGSKGFIFYNPFSPYSSKDQNNYKDSLHQYYSYSRQKILQFRSPRTWSNCSNPFWSPDGTKFAFGSGTHLLVYDTNDDKTNKVATAESFGRPGMYRWFGNNYILLGGGRFVNVKTKRILKVDFQSTEPHRSLLKRIYYGGNSLNNALINDIHSEQKVVLLGGENTLYAFQLPETSISWFKGML